MAKKRGRKSKRLYFTEDTELAIIEYLASEDQIERNKIYNISFFRTKLRIANIDAINRADIIPIIISISL